METIVCDIHGKCDVVLFDAQDKGISSNQKREKHLKSIGLQKHKIRTTLALQNETDKQLI